MKGLKSAILWTAALMTSCFFISCENDMREVDSLMKDKVAVEEAVKVTSYMSQEGRMKAKLSAPFMLRHQTDSAFIEFPKTLHVDFFDSTGRIESTLDALYARYREYEQKVFLRDSVVVISVQKGDTLRTDELWWDQNKQEFYTDKRVRLHQPDKTIFGTGLRAAQDFSWYNFFNITGTVLSNSNTLE